MPLHPQAEKFLKVWNSLNTPPIETTPVAEMRRILLSGVGLLPNCPPMAAVADHFVPGPGGDIRVRVCTPDNAVSRGAAFYFHGGGWVLNSVDTHDDVVRRMASAAGCTFLNVDYRLAPEHPYPAAVEDAYAVLEWAVQHADELGIDPQRLAVAGDSAGGNIAAALCLMTRDRGGPAISQQCLIYPITDCDLTRASYVENAEGYFLTTRQMHWFWDQYCPDVSRRNEPYASPIRGDLRGLPPALIMTAEFDPLRDEGEAYANALFEAGVATAHHRFDGLIHAFVRRVESFDAANVAIREIGDTLRKVFAE